MNMSCLCGHSKAKLSSINCGWTLGTLINFSYPVSPTQIPGPLWVTTNELPKGFLCAAQDPGYAENTASTSSETKVVSLRADLEGTSPPFAHDLAEHDCIDTTVGPNGPNGTAFRNRRLVHMENVMTPRQHHFKEAVQLPKLLRYPSLPKDFTLEEGNEEYQEREVLLQLFREFALDMNRGRYLTQLGSNQDYSVIHCQVMDDLQTLKVDQGNGCIIEFPLTGVSKVYRIVKTDERLTSMSSTPAQNIEHIVVVEFMRRKLAFVFTEVQEAQRFLLCMELMIRRAQEEVRDGADGQSCPRGSQARSTAGTAPFGGQRRPVRPLLGEPKTNTGVECVCKHE
ncbi:unnamed protein product [Durusdinium trenchii]|uniref:Uncharacterized protein n=1 Tax=Durusdinium trenchii TaxID=1381693 RepID=A0ABP0P1L2_9DINO